MYRSFRKISLLFIISPVHPPITTSHKQSMKSNPFLGQTLSKRYLIQKEIGTGGFASVFKAQDIQKDRAVAVKILAQKTTTNTDEKREERFVREARVHLKHPNIVQIFELNHHDAPPCTYIAMELLHGHDLRKELEENGPLSPSRCIEFVIQALNALDTAHQKDIVHRDIKPENLFIQTPDETDEIIKVLDFGIARMHTEHTLSLTGQILGTHKYLAPEYIQDNIITSKLDIYQMGLVLVELLTGTPVVDTDHAMTGFRQHIRGSIEIPLALLESSLGPILLQALHNDHTQRFASASQFAQALSSIDTNRIPTGEKLKEKIALNTYQKGRSILEMSSEDDAVEEEHHPPAQSSQNKLLPIFIFAAISIAIGFAFTML